MSSVNKVILIGNLGKDPELRYTERGTARCNLSIATSRWWKDQQGQRQEETSWHRVVAYGKVGENCKQYLSKGRKVYVEGRLNTYSIADEAGGKRYFTDIVSNVVMFLGGPRPAETSGHAPQQQQAAVGAGEDLPF